ncbi:hypothetical protein BDQ17DRAFT_1428658 [Cyathus striatus]|nr:hypothetical protein BDQ17DRAFT_1428658 [Cyathus striatus]
MSVRQGHHCGTSISQDDVLATEQQFQIDEALDTSPNHAECHFGPVNIYFHIVAANDTVEGWLSDTAINDQMSVLNDCFNTTGLQWTLASVDRMINETWFRSVYSVNKFNYEMKTQLQVGNVFDLNIFTIWFETSFFVGYATFPQNYTVSPTLDRIVIHHSNFPGGCYDEGDMVNDTPVEDDSTYGCHMSRDTCPHVPGEDPIYNYMDYSLDCCMYEFTPGQVGQVVHMRDQ